MATAIELKVSKRQELGKAADRLRKKGVIPAEVYGHGSENIHASIEAAAFTSVYRKAGENTVVTLDIDGDKRSVLIYDVQKDPITDVIRHVDFYQVRMDETIETEIPLSFKGESPAIKLLGAILVKSLQSLPVESLPGDLPHEIAIDISGLTEFGMTIYVRDIALPKGVTAKINTDMAIVSIIAPKVEEEEPVVEEAATVATVAVEAEEKKTERDAAKAKAETEEKK